MINPPIGRIDNIASASNFLKAKIWGHSSIWLEHLTHNQVVPGSSPGGPTYKFGLRGQKVMKVLFAPSAPWHRKCQGAIAKFV